MGLEEENEKGRASEELEGPPEGQGEAEGVVVKKVGFGDGEVREDIKWFE